MRMNNCGKVLFLLLLFQLFSESFAYTWLYGCKVEIEFQQFIDTCTPCHTECKGCFGPTASDCVACLHFYENGKCVPTCSESTSPSSKNICISTKTKPPFCSQTPPLSENNDASCIQPPPKNKVVFKHEITGAISYPNACPSGYIENTLLHTCDPISRCSSQITQTPLISSCFTSTSSSSIINLTSGSEVYRHNEGIIFSTILIRIPSTSGTSSTQSVALLSVSIIIFYDFSSLPSVTDTLRQIPLSQSSEEFLAAFQAKQTTTSPTSLFDIIYCKTYSFGAYVSSTNTFYQSTSASLLSACHYLSDSNQLLLTTGTTVTLYNEFNHSLTDPWTILRSIDTSTQYNLIGYSTTTNSLYLTGASSSFLQIDVYDITDLSKVESISNFYGVPYTFSNIQRGSLPPQLLLSTNQNMLFFNESNPATPQAKPLFAKCSRSTEKPFNTQLVEFKIFEDNPFNDSTIGASINLNNNIYIAEFKKGTSEYIRSKEIASPHLPTNRLISIDSSTKLFVYPTKNRIVIIGSKLTSSTNETTQLVILLSLSTFSVISVHELASIQWFPPHILLAKTSDESAYSMFYLNPDAADASNELIRLFDQGIPNAARIYTSDDSSIDTNDTRTADFAIISKQTCVILHDLALKSLTGYFINSNSSEIKQVTYSITTAGMPGFVIPEELIDQPTQELLFVSSSEIFIFDLSITSSPSPLAPVRSAASDQIAINGQISHIEILSSHYAIITSLTEVTRSFYAIDVTDFTVVGTYYPVDNQSNQVDILTSFIYAATYTESFNSSKKGVKLFVVTYDSQTATASDSSIAHSVIKYKLISGVDGNQIQSQQTFTATANPYRRAFIATTSLLRLNVRELVSLEKTKQRYNLQIGKESSSGSLIPLSDSRISNNLHIFPDISLGSVYEPPAKLNESNFVEGKFFFPAHNVYFQYYRPSLYDYIDIYSVVNYLTNEVLFTYSQSERCNGFIPIASVKYDTVVICDALQLYILNISQIPALTKSQHVLSTYCSNIDLCQFLISETQPYAFVNSYGVFYFLEDRMKPASLTFVSQFGDFFAHVFGDSLYVAIIGYETQVRIFRYSPPDFQLVVWTMNRQFYQIEYNVFRDNHIVLAGKSVDILSYSDFTILRTFVGNSLVDPINTKNPIYDCTAAQKLFVLYLRRIDAYDLPLTSTSVTSFSFAISSSYSFAACTNTHILLNLYDYTILSVNLATSKRDLLIDVSQYKSFISSWFLSSTAMNSLFIPSKKLHIIENLIFSEDGTYISVQETYIYKYVESSELLFGYDTNWRYLNSFIFKADLSIMFPFKANQFQFENSIRIPFLQLKTTATNSNNSNFLIYIDLISQNLMFYSSNDGSTLSNNELTPTSIAIPTRLNTNYDCKLLRITDTMYLAIIPQKGFMTFTNEQIVDTFVYSDHFEFDFILENFTDQQNSILAVLGTKQYRITIDSDLGVISIPTQTTDIFPSQSISALSFVTSYKSCIFGFDSNIKTIFSSCTNPSTLATSTASHVLTSQISTAFTQPISFDSKSIYIFISFTDQNESIIMNSDFTATLMSLKSIGTLRFIYFDEFQQNILFADKYFMYFISSQFEVIQQLPISTRGTLAVKRISNQILAGIAASSVMLIHSSDSGITVMSSIKNTSFSNIRDAMLIIGDSKDYLVIVDSQSIYVYIKSINDINSFSYLQQAPSLLLSLISCSLIRENTHNIMLQVTGVNINGPANELLYLESISNNPAAIQVAATTTSSSSTADSCYQLNEMESSILMQRRQILSLASQQSDMSILTLQISQDNVDILVPSFSSGELPKQINIVYDLQGKSVNLLLNQGYSNITLDTNAVASITFKSGTIKSSELISFSSYSSISFVDVLLEMTSLKLTDCMTVAFTSVTFVPVSPILSILVMTRNSSNSKQQLTILDSLAYIALDSSAPLIDATNIDSLTIDVLKFKQQEKQSSLRSRRVLPIDGLSEYGYLLDVYNVATISINQLTMESMILPMKLFRFEIIEEINMQSISFNDISTSDPHLSHLILMRHVKSKVKMIDVNVQSCKFTTFLHINDTTVLTQEDYMYRNQTTTQSIILSQFKFSNNNQEIQNANSDLSETLPYIVIQGGAEVILSNFIVHASSMEFHSFMHVIDVNEISLSRSEFHAVNRVSQMLHFESISEIVNIASVTFYSCSQVSSFIAAFNSQIQIEDVNIDSMHSVTGSTPLLTPPLMTNSSIIIIVSTPAADITQQQTARIIDSSIQNAQCELCDGAGIFAAGLNLIYLENVSISKCETGNNGGGLAITDSELRINAVQINDNTAMLSGGGIYAVRSTILLSDTHSNGQVSSIRRNSALIGGGIRYIRKYDNQIVITRNIANIISDNSAVLFGNNYTQAPVSIELTQETLSNIQTTISSAQQTKQKLVFRIFDEEGKAVKFSNLKQYQNSENSRVIKLINEIESYRTVILESNEIIFDQDLSKTKYIGDIIPSTDDLELNVYFLLDPNSKSQFYLTTTSRLLRSRVATAEFRTCQPGEIIKNTKDSIHSECFACQERTYSIIDPETVQTDTQLKCKDCPISSQYCSGNIVVPSNGYWIEEGSDEIYSCFNEPENCIVTFASYPSYKNFKNCITGAAGARCESCDYSGAQGNGKFGKQGYNSCSSCDQQTNVAWKTVLLLIQIIGMGLYFSGLVVMIIQRAITYLKATYIQRAGIVNFGTSLSQSISSLFIKKLISYVQLATILSEFDFKSSLFMKDVANIAANPLDVTKYSFDCVMLLHEWDSSIPLPYVRLLWVLFTCLVNFLLTILVVVLYFNSTLKTHKGIDRKLFIKRIIVTVACYNYFVHCPTLVQKFSEILLCESVGTKSYILADLQYECYTKEDFLFSFLLCLPFLILLIVVIPALMYYKLKSYSKKSLMYVGPFVKFGFFYQEYKKEFYYWEVFRIVYMALIYLGINVFKNNIVAKGSFLCIALIIQTRLTFKTQPYQKKILNKFDQLANFTLLACFQIGIINAQSTNSSLRFLAGFIVVALNIIFLITIVAKTLRLKIRIAKDSKVSKLVEQIEKRFPGLLKQFFTFHSSCYQSHKNWNKIRNFIQLSKSSKTRASFGSQSVKKQQVKLGKRDTEIVQSNLFLESVPS